MKRTLEQYLEDARNSLGDRGIREQGGIQETVVSGIRKGP